MARKGSLISCNLANGALVFAVEGVKGNITVNPANLSDDIRHVAMLHGLKQKVSDGAALEKGATPEEKFAGMLAIANRLAEGEWSKRNGDGSGPVVGLIYRAFARWVEEMATAKKKPVPDAEAIRARYDGMDRKQQLALRNVERIAEIIAEIKAERGGDTATIDTDNLLGELGI